MPLQLSIYPAPLYIWVQFDYLKSLEIEEKINKIRWCQTANSALFLLSTNDKTIKFWKVGKHIFSWIEFYHISSFEIVCFSSLSTWLYHVKINCFSAKFFVKYILMCKTCNTYLVSKKFWVHAWNISEVLETC